MRKVKFDATKAAALYKAGTGIADIAVEMGYKRGQGQNRTRAALAKAGVWKKNASRPRKRGKIVAQKATPIAAALVKEATQATLPVPTGREVALRACFLFVEAQYKKMIGRQRTNFVKELSGMLLAGISNAEGPQKITLVQLPESFRQTAA